MTKPLPVRQRAYAPKTRSGCIACKSRRRKCDEERPQCRACIRRGLSCTYKTVRSQPRDTAALATIQPKPIGELQLYVPSQSAFSGLESIELIYLDYFLRKIVHRLSFPRQDNAGLAHFISRTSLQQCEHNDHILHAVVGIGALAYVRQSHSTQYPLYQHHLSRCLQNVHYRRAIKHYNQAIASTRRLLQDDNDTRSATTQSQLMLITCVLFVLFEQLQDNIDAVDQLTASVVKFLKTPIRGNVSGGGGGGPPVAVIDDTGITEAEHFICNYVVNNSMFSPMHPRCRESLHNLAHLSTQMPAVVGPDKSIPEFISTWYRVGTVLISPSLASAQGGGGAVSAPFPRAALQAMMSEWELECKRRLAGDPKPAGHFLFLLRYVSLSCRALTRNPAGEIPDVCISVDTDEMQGLMSMIEREMATRSPGLALEDSELVDEGSYDLLLPFLFLAARDLASYPARRQALEICRRILRPSSSWSTKAIFLGMCALVEIDGAKPAEGVGPPPGPRYTWTEGRWNADYTRLHVILTAAETGGEGCSPKRRHLIVSREAYGLA